MTVLIITLSVLWYAVGVWVFVKWWLKEFDFSTNELPLAFFSGFLGPINYFINWIMEIQDEEKIIIKKRRD